MSHYRYHTTLSSHEFAVFNMLTDSRSVDKSSPSFFFVMLLFVCVFAILVRNYNTALSSHEFVGFNVLTDSADKSSPAFFVFMSLFVCVFMILGESRTRLQNCYLCQKSVTTIINQVRPVCSQKDKISPRTDKLQRYRRLPLEQAKLRQILESNNEEMIGQVIRSRVSMV